jgi:hypothetical protein
MDSGSYSRCVEACNTCADACDRCMSACLLEPEVQDMAHCIALDLECAAVCRLLAGFASRGSKFAPQLAGVCCAVCEACAQECGDHPHDHCQVCAERCHLAKDACLALMTLGVPQPAATPGGGGGQADRIAEGSDAPVA